MHKILDIYGNDKTDFYLGGWPGEQGVLIGPAPLKFCWNFGSIPVGLDSTGDSRTKLHPNSTWAILERYDTRIWNSGGCLDQMGYEIIRKSMY